MSFVVSRKRKIYKQAKRPTLTPEQKNSQKARSAELEARLDNLAEYIHREAKAVAQEFNKSASYVRGRIFAGPKGAAFLRSTRKTHRVRVYDAYMHHKAKELREDAERNDKVALNELRTIVRNEEPHYSDRSEDDKKAWIEEYKADVLARNTQRRVNRKAEQQDATFTFKHMAGEVETLELRTGVKSFYFGVRSDMLQTIQPFFACTPDVAQFFNIVLGKTPDQIIALFEMWAIGGMRGVFGINAKNAVELKKDVRRLVQKGLDAILQARYGEGKAPAVSINYADYEGAIVAKHAVRLVGWTYEEGIVNPGVITPVEELRKLYDALISEACHWEVVPEKERTDAAAKKKRRAPTKKADSGPNKKAKTATGAASKPTAKRKSAAVVPSSSDSSSSSESSESDED